MTRSLSIANTIKGNKISVIDKLTLKSAFKTLLQLEANYEENDGVMSFYIISAKEDDGYKSKPISPRLLLYKKTILFCKNPFDDKSQ